MTQAECSDKFYDWAEGTQISRMSGIADFGPSDEVCETDEILFDDELSQLLVKNYLMMESASRQRKL